MLAQAETPMVHFTAPCGFEASNLLWDQYHAIGLHIYILRAQEKPLAPQLDFEQLEKHSESHTSRPKEGRVVSNLNPAIGCCDLFSLGHEIKL